MNSDSNHHQQTTALKYLNAVFCSILVQGAQGFVVNENNIAMTGALTEASRISIPTEPYDFSLEKSVIQKFDEIKGEDENTETANSLEDNEAPVSASSGSPVNDTESNRNNAQSSPLTSALPFLIPPQENVLSSSTGGPSITIPSDDVAGSSSQIPSVTTTSLDKASGWEAVGVAAALMNEGSETSGSTQELRGISRLSEYESSDYSSAASTKSSINEEQASTINSMVEVGDWSGVVLAAKGMGTQSAKKAKTSKNWRVRRVLGGKSSTKPQKEEDVSDDDL